MNRYLTTIATLKATEFGCKQDDFFSDLEVLFVENPSIPFRMVSFGSTTVICGRADILDAMKDQLDTKKDGKELFDAPALCIIGEVLKQYGLSLSEIYDYYIPAENMDRIEKGMDSCFTMRRLCKSEMLQLVDMEEYDNALCVGEAADINEFAYAAMYQGKIASIAGVSSNTELLWWVGVDTRKAYRGKGLAAALVNHIAIDVMKINKIPVYVTWYANIASRKTALRAGFIPGFVELGCEPL